MPGDAFRHVTSGEKFRPSARAWNALMRLAGQTDMDQEAGAPSFGRDADLVKIQNNTNTNLNQFAILGLDVPLITPAQNAHEFRRQITFAGVVPLSNTHQGKYAILQQPLAVNAIGWGLVAGVTPVVVNTLNTTSRSFAEVVNNNSALLRAGSTGSAQLMWVENTNAAVTNAVVRILGPIVPTFVGGIVGVTNTTALADGIQTVPFDNVYCDPLGLWDQTNHRFNIGALGGTWRLQMSLYLSYTGQAVNSVFDAWFFVSDNTVGKDNLGVGYVYTPVAAGNISIPCFGAWAFSGGGNADNISATVFANAAGGKTANLLGASRCIFCIEQVVGR